MTPSREDAVAKVLESAQGSREAPARDACTAAALLPLVYDELRALAASLFVNQRPDQTLQPTALVHEAFLRLVRHRADGWNDQAHFFNAASMAMRQLLADHARARGALKRGGGATRVSLDEIELSRVENGIDIVVLDAALSRLAALNARHARIAELRFLAGLSVEQAALVLGVSARTVEADWRFARAWLHRELSRGESS